MKDVRDEAFDGNSLVLNDVLTTAIETAMQADAYECE